MILNEETMQMIVQTDIANGLQVWTGVAVPKFFESYRIESQNANIVGFEVCLDHLIQALKSAQYSTNACAS